jgi:hypothetical protein
LRFEKHRHGNGPEHYAHEDARGVIELYPAKGEAGDQTGLGFSSTNLGVLRDALSSEGFGPEEIKNNPWGRTFVVRDPDGRRVEIKEQQETP